MQIKKNNVQVSAGRLRKGGGDLTNVVQVGRTTCTNNAFDGMIPNFPQSGNPWDGHGEMIVYFIGKHQPLSLRGLEREK